MTEKEQECEYRTVKYLVAILGNMCAASPNMIIDRLTGLLWDEDEADKIKNVNMKD